MVAPLRRLASADVASHCVKVPGRLFAGREVARRRPRLVLLDEDDAGLLKRAAPLVLGGHLGSVVPRSNASVVLIGTPERSDSTLRDQPIKTRAARSCRGVNTVAEYAFRARTPIIWRVYP